MKRPLNDTAHVGHPEPTAASVVEDETKNANRQSMADKLEAIFERMADEMLHERGSISVMLKRRASTANGEDARVQSITFPGKNPEEAWRFGTSWCDHAPRCVNTDTGTSGHHKNHGADVRRTARRCSVIEEVMMIGSLSENMRRV